MVYWRRPDLNFVYRRWWHGIIHTHCLGADVGWAWREACGHKGAHLNMGRELIIRQLHTNSASREDDFDTCFVYGPYSWNMFTLPSLKRFTHSVAVVSTSVKFSSHLDKATFESAHRSHTDTI